MMGKRRTLKKSEVYEKSGNPISTLGDLKEALAHPDCQYLEASIVDSCGFDSCIGIKGFVYHKGVLILTVSSHIPTRDKTQAIHFRRLGLTVNKFSRQRIADLDLPDDTILALALQSNYSKNGLHKLIPVDHIGMNCFVGWKEPDEGDYEVSTYGGFSLDSDTKPDTMLILKEKLDA